MSQTYQTQGIVLARKHFGESDRLVTLLTPDFGIVKAVAPGARKYHSSLRGRVELFVVNELMLVKGRSIDRLIQAQTITSYRGLASNLDKLSASQYLLELVLCMGLSEQPQTELYRLLLDHLGRLESVKESNLLIPHLTQAVFHFLTLAGIAPCVDRCCLSQQILSPDFEHSSTCLGFSFANGGVFILGSGQSTSDGSFEAKLGAIELSLLQYLRNSQLPELHLSNSYSSWCKLEQLLREYAQYHFNYSFRSSVLTNNLSQKEF